MSTLLEAIGSIVLETYFAILGLSSKWISYWRQPDNKACSMCVVNRIRNNDQKPSRSAPSTWAGPAR